MWKSVPLNAGSACSSVHAATSPSSLQQSHIFLKSSHPVWLEENIKHRSIGQVVSAKRYSCWVKLMGVHHWSHGAMMCIWWYHVWRIWRRMIHRMIHNKRHWLHFWMMIGRMGVTHGGNVPPSWSCPPGVRKLYFFWKSWRRRLVGRRRITWDHHWSSSRRGRHTLVGGAHVLLVGGIVGMSPPQMHERRIWLCVSGHDSGH